MHFLRGFAILLLLARVLACSTLNSLNRFYVLSWAEEMPD